MNEAKRLNGWKPGGAARNEDFDPFWDDGVDFFLLFAATPEPQSKQAKEIKTLVDKGAALVERKGKDAFPEFRKKGSAWFNGDVISSSSARRLTSCFTSTY